MIFIYNKSQTKVLNPLIREVKCEIRVNPPAQRGLRIMLFIERSGLNFLFYKGKSVTCLVTKNSSYRIPPCNFSLSSFKKTYDFISFTSVSIFEATSSQAVKCRGCTRRQKMCSGLKINSSSKRLHA